MMIREGERGSNEKEVFFKVERDTHTNGKGDTDPKQTKRHRKGRGRVFEQFL